MIPPVLEYERKGKFLRYSLGWLAGRADGDSQRRTAAYVSGPHVAILESDEWDRYRAALGHVTELVQQAHEEKAALERTNCLISGAVCAVGMAWFSLRMGLSLWVIVAFAGVFWTMYVGMARIRAEAGVPEHDLNFLSPQESPVAVFGARAVGSRSLSAMSLCVWFSRRKRNYLMPHQLEAFKIAEREGLPNRAVFGVLLLATVAGLGHRLSARTRRSAARRTARQCSA